MHACTWVPAHACQRSVVCVMVLVLLRVAWSRVWGVCAACGLWGAANWDTPQGKSRERRRWRS